MGKSTIRDFIYLDVERLKSILAQLEEGYLEGVDKTTGSTKTLKGGAEAHIPGLAKMGGTGQYLWTSQVSETRTLHDHIYIYVEEKLREKRLITVLHEDLTPEAWLSDDRRGIVPETAFVLVRGTTLINDYGYLKEFLVNFNKVAAAIGRLPAYDTAKGKPNAKTILAQASKQLQIDEGVLKDLDLMLKRFVRNDTIVKIMPFPDHPDARVVTNLDVSDAFRSPLETLLFRFGSAPRGTWTLFGQVAAIPLSSDTPFKFGGTLGGELDGALQKMFDALRGFEPLIGSVVYPEIAVIPIALYRG